MKPKHFFLSIWVAAGLGLAACSGAAPATVTASPSGGEEFRAGLVAEGQVQPVAYVDLSFGASGQVAEVLVSEGEAVSAGQVLARLADSPLAAAEAARAEQAVLDAQQALDTLANGADLAVAQARLEQASAARQLEAAQQAVEALEEARAEAEADDNQEAPTDRELAEAQAQVTVAEARLALAQAQAERLAEAGNDPAAQAAAEARLATAQAALASARAAQAALELTAPQAGTVVGLALKAGQHIGAGQLALTLADFSSWIIQTADLNELEVAQVEPGQTVEVILDALPQTELSGTLVTLAPRYEEKRGDITYTGTIHLDSVDPAVRWGMTAAVWFQP
jgi:multidrug resistance efflux pump